LANSAYLLGRKKWERPQAVIWLDNTTSLDNNINIDGNEYENFLILSDHNRSEIRFSTQRIENRKRMINGTMRSYHIADKLNISWSWDMLPSRSFNADPLFNSSGKVSSASATMDYTADGGAGGREILSWYQNHPGAFYMLLSYDTYNGIPNSNQYAQLSKYNQILPVYFSNFEYTIQKRGATNHDMWNISVQLEEA
jgi:hypothetical protein